MYSRPYNPDRLAAPHRSKRYSRRPVSVQTGRNSRGRRLPADRARLPGRFPGESQCFYCRNGYSAGHGVHLRAPPWSPNNSLRQQQVRRELRTRRESVPQGDLGNSAPQAAGWPAPGRPVSTVFSFNQWERFGLMRLKITIFCGINNRKTRCEPISTRFGYGVKIISKKSLHLYQLESK